MTGPFASVRTEPTVFDQPRRIVPKTVYGRRSCPRESVCSHQCWGSFRRKHARKQPPGPAPAHRCLADAEPADSAAADHAAGRLAGATDCQVLLAAGSGIGNKQLEDEAAVVRTDAHGTVDVRDEFRVDAARPNLTPVNGHLTGISSSGLRHRRP